MIRDRFQKITEANRDEIYGETKRDILQIMQKQLRPEFLNRIDEVIVFHPLTREHIHDIVDIQFERMIRSTLLRQGLDAELTDKAKNYLAEQGYDPVFGARPLKRLLQRQILNEFAAKILKGEIAKGDVIRIDAKNGVLQFEEIMKTKPVAS